MSLLLTRMQNLRAQNNELDQHEYRLSRYGAHELFRAQTDAPGGILSADLRAKALQSIGRTLEQPVINYDGGVTVGNARTVTIADDENASQMVSFTFATLAWGFTIVPSLYMNNEIAMQEDFNKKFIKYLYPVLNSMDNLAIAGLEAAKTQVLSDTLGGKYALTSNVLVAPVSLQDEIIGDINPLMHGNDFYGPITLVASNSTDSLVRNRLFERGTMNELDKTYQYNDKAFRFSNRITDGTGVKSTFYAVSGNQTGLLVRLEREALFGRRARTGHEWGVDQLPIAGVPVGTYYYESVGDYSGIAGAASADMDRVMKEHYGWALDVCYVTAHNSDRATIPSGILKVEVATT